MNGNTKLTNAANYDVSRMVFQKPETNNVPGSQLSYKRINIGTVNDDGTVGDLVLETSRLFSFGVSENKSLDTGAINGHTMPLCLWTKDGATKEEKEFTDTINNIVERCKEHLLDENVKEELEKYELEANDLKKFNPLYWKREKGKIVEGQGPILYAKLIESKKTSKILSFFYDEATGEEIEPLSLMGKYCYTRAAIKIESIFVGAKIVLQIKLYEAAVQVAQSGPKRLLARPTAVSGVGSSSASNPMHEDAPAAPSRPAPTTSKTAAPVRQAEEEDIEDDEAPAPKPVATTSAARKVVPPKKK